MSLIKKPILSFAIIGDSSSNNFLICFRFFVIPYILNALGLSEEKSIKAILTNGFVKKKNFTRFVKSQLSTTKNGKLNVEILKGQESFRIKSFVNSNIWVLLPAGKSKFKNNGYC